LADEFGGGTAGTPGWVDVPKAGRETQSEEEEKDRGQKAGRESWQNTLKKKTRPNQIRKNARRANVPENSNRGHTVSATSAPKVS